jgi:hypothetical protein
VAGTPDAYPNYLASPPSAVPGSLAAHCADGWGELSGFAINAGSGGGRALFQQTATTWRFVKFDGETGVGPGVNTCLQYPPAAVQALGAYLCGNPTGGPTSTTSVANATGGWHSAVLDKGIEFSSLRCSSVQLCIADGNNSGGESFYFEYNGSIWKELGNSGNNLYSLPIPTSCPTTSLCVSVTPEGQVVTSRGQSAGTPTEIDPGTALTGVSCPSTSFCVAVDEDGHALTFNGSTWSPPVVISGEGAEYKQSNIGLTDVSCPSASFCVAVDGWGDAFTFNGSAWGPRVLVDKAGDFNPGPLHVSCASAAFCAVVDSTGDALTFNGSTWSSPTHVDGSRSLDVVACPTTSFCLALDDDGNVLTYSPTQ